MKNVSVLAAIIFALFAFISCDNSDEKDPLKTSQTLEMGSDYAHDIYFSLANGVVSTPNRTQWDIAFYTSSRSSSILINDGNSLRLYPWKSAAEWDLADTVGLYLKPCYTNKYTGESWQNGAFDQGAKGHPDYGWGVYNMNTHNMDGDSVYVLKFADGSVKKIWIEQRKATNNTFYFRFANLDGTDLKIDSVNCNNYLDKNMVHYSLVNKTVVDHQPKSSEWDLLFTKYYPHNMNWNVTGVLTNNGLEVAKLTDVDVNSNNYQSATFIKSISAIGWEWKQTDENYAYYIPEKEIYFVKDQAGKVYKIVFTSFEGKATGKLSFDLTSY